MSSMQTYSGGLGCQYAITKSGGRWEERVDLEN